MGVIQNNFNKLLGLSLGAVGTAKHLESQAISNKTTALNQYEILSQEQQAYNTDKANIAQEQASIDEKMTKNRASAEKMNKKIEEQGYAKKGQSLYMAALEKSYNSLAEKQELLKGRKATLDERAKFLKEKGSNVNSLLEKAKIKNLKVGGID